MTVRLHTGGKAAMAAAALTLMTGAAQAADPIVGAWLGTIQPADCATGASLPAPAARGMLLYQHGGTLVNTDTNLTSRGPGFGTWWRDGNGYQTRFTFLRIDNGAAVGTTLVSRTVELDADRKSSQGFAVVQLFDMDGNLLPVGPFCSNDSGTRLP